jgi:hypothetical protein
MKHFRIIDGELKEIPDMSRRDRREALELAQYVEARQTRDTSEDESRLDRWLAENTRYHPVAIEVYEPPRPNVFIRRDDIMRAFCEAINYSDRFASDRGYYERFERALDMIVGEQSLKKFGKQSRRKPL